MPDVRLLRVFVASPGDVGHERDEVERALDEINRDDGVRSDFRLEVLRWERDAAPGGGRPQAVINADIGDYELFVGVMWRRFGTPTGVADSGTEEEFRLAYQRWQQQRVEALMFYFCQAPFMPRTVDELDQMRKVLLFRRELAQKALIWDYEGPDSFAGEIRKHLRKRVESIVSPVAKPAQPDDATIDVLRDLWGRMTPDLQRAFSIAYNEKRLAGDGGIDTWTFFAALQEAADDPQFDRLVRAIRSSAGGALPQRIDGPAVSEPYLVDERPWLSGCVSSAIRRLSEELPPGRQLTGTDIFVDIAKHGTGDSVRLLREHNIGPQEIDRFVIDNDIDVVVTHPR